MSNNLEILTQALGEYQITGDELLFFCPFCSHRKRKLSVNRKTFYWKCWVCDRAGRSHFSLLWQSDYKHLCNKLSKDFEFTQPESENFALELPKEYVALANRPNKRALKYLSKRGVSQDQVLRFKIGYCHDGKYQNRVILPSFAHDGYANFYTGRAISGEELRYLNPKTPVGYKKSIILNELNLNWQKPVTIVEGFFDMLRVENATPIFGSVLADDCILFQQIVLRQARVFVCLDPDARLKQLKLISAFNNYGIQAYDVQMAQSDLADASKDAIIEAFSCAKPLDRIAFLREKLKC